MVSHYFLALPLRAMFMSLLLAGAYRGYIFKTVTHVRMSAVGKHVTSQQARGGNRHTGHFFFPST